MTRPRLSITKDLLIEKEIMGYDNHVTVMFKENDEIKSGFYKACNKHSYPQLLAKYEVAFSVFMRLTQGNHAAEVRLVYDNESTELIGVLSLQVPQFIPVDSASSHILAETLLASYKHERDLELSREFNANGFVNYDELYAGLTQQVVPEEKYPLKFPKHKNIGFFEKLKKNSTFEREINKAILKHLLAFDENVLEQRLQLYLENVSLDLHLLSSDKQQKLLKFAEEDQLFKVEEPHSFIKHCMRLFKLEHKKFENIVTDRPGFKEFLYELHEKPFELIKIRMEIEKMDKIHNIPNKLEHFDQQFEDLFNTCLGKSSEVTKTFIMR